MMEHMVDVVLYFEGDRQYQFRILRSIKNRFGSTNDSGLFTMTEGGLSELENPSQLLLAERAANQAGSSIAAVMDGQRPLLGEIQALTTHSVFAVPRRTASGMDYNRLIILLAVLENGSVLPSAARTCILTSSAACGSQKHRQTFPLPFPLCQAYRIFLWTHVLSSWAKLD